MHRKGKLVTVLDLPELAENKLAVYVETSHGSYMIMAYELLSWQLRSLLRVKIYRAELKNGTTAPKKNQKISV